MKDYKVKRIKTDISFFTKESQTVMGLRTFNHDKHRHLQDIAGTYNHIFF